MAPTKNGRMILNERPEGYPVPGKTTVYEEKEIELNTIPLNGGILIKTLVLSLDPYLRGRMNDWPLGEPLLGFGIATVLRSENPKFPVGKHVYSNGAEMPFQEYSVITDTSTYITLENMEGLPWSAYIGVCGMPGKTAWYGWKEYADAKRGETVFISTGAGAVGAFVIQLAKSDGLKVIASAGSDDKVEWMKSLGADVAFNYKTTDTNEVLQKEGPINIYWDHVGGATLDAALGNTAIGARFIECGMISHYNNKDGVTLKNFTSLMYKQTKIFGHFVVPFEPKYSEEFYATVPKMVAEGKLKHKEEIHKGLEKAGHLILEQQTGKNFGKSVLIIAEE